jgi:cytoskeletal protein CcmA (bactofilin family)
MFSKENRLEKFKDAETVIGSSIKVKGNFQGKGNIVIEGMLEGSVKTEANLFIGEDAKVVANIEATDSSIHGEVHGNVRSRGYLAIGKAARIFGDIQYSEISIEKGAIINGQLVAISESEKKAKGRKEEAPEETEEQE